MSDHVHEEEEWRPPNEAEMEQIRRRRERSDRISQIMSQYLLRGYKMLASVCHKCDVSKFVLNLRYPYCSVFKTVMLEDQTGRQFCVACTEVDREQQANVANNGESFSGNSKRYGHFFQILKVQERILSKINQLFRRRTRFPSFIRTDDHRSKQLLQRVIAWK